MVKRGVKKPNWRWRLIFLAVAVTTVILVMRQVSGGVPFGMREVKSFRAYGVCDKRTDPACGFCPGTVENDRCFVGFGSFNQYP